MKYVDARNAPHREEVVVGDPLDQPNVHRPEEPASQAVGLRGEYRPFIAISALRSALRTVDEDGLWRLRGLCVVDPDADPDAFYEVLNNSRLQSVRELCGRCTVKHECLAFALTNDERNGVWGGMTVGGRWRVQAALGGRSSSAEHIPFS